MLTIYINGPEIATKNRRRMYKQKIRQEKKDNKHLLNIILNKINSNYCGEAFEFTHYGSIAPEHSQIYVKQKLELVGWNIKFGEVDRWNNIVITITPPSDDFFIPVKSTPILRIRNLFRRWIGKSELMLIDY